MDEKDYRRLPDSIYAEIYPRLAERQGAAHGREEGFSWADSPHPVWGRACYGLDLDGNREAILAALAAKSLELGSCRIMTGPSSSPESAEEILAAAGFRRGRYGTGMVLRQDEFRPRSRPAGLSIDEPGGEADWAEWSGIVCRELFGRADAEACRAFAGAGRALASGPGFRAFLGRDGEGRAVATSASLACASGTGGVFFVAVDSAARKRGYGAALTSRASRACFEAGFAYASLGATEEGEPVYGGLGYRAVSSLGRFLPPGT